MLVLVLVLVWVLELVLVLVLVWVLELVLGLVLVLEEVVVGVTELGLHIDYQLTLLVHIQRLVLYHELHISVSLS
jgi:hypothetical protein